MPTFLAIILATALAWVVGHASFGIGSPRVQALLGFIVWLVAFYLTKRLLSHLRPGE